MYPTTRRHLVQKATHKYQEKKHFCLPSSIHQPKDTTKTLWLGHYRNISVCHHQYISPRTQQKPSGLATREKKQKNKKTKNVYFIKVSLHAITNQQNKIKHKEYSRRPLGMVNILEDKPVRKHPGCF